MRNQDLVVVARAWAHKDDWNVDSIYIGQLADIAEALDAGDDPKVLVKHGKHVAATCIEVGCIRRIPFTISKDDKLRQLLAQSDSIANARITRARDIRSAAIIAADSNPDLAQRLHKLAQDVFEGKSE